MPCWQPQWSTASSHGVDSVDPERAVDADGEPARRAVQHLAKAPPRSPHPCLTGSGCRDSDGLSNIGKGGGNEAARCRASGQPLAAIHAKAARSSSGFSGARRGRTGRFPASRIPPGPPVARDKARDPKASLSGAHAEGEPAPAHPPGRSGPDRAVGGRNDRAVRGGHVGRDHAPRCRGHPGAAQRRQATVPGLRGRRRGAPVHLSGAVPGKPQRGHRDGAAGQARAASARLTAACGVASSTG